MAQATTAQRTALVTGAASGLGACFAERLAQRGFDLVLVDRQGDRLPARAADLEGRFGVKATGLAQDLRDPEAARKIVAFARSLGRPIDFLVNNAGFHLSKLFREHAWRDIEDNVRVLLDVVVELTHHLLPGMIERRWGRVINVASMSGFMPGGVRLATYNGTKAFLVPFTEALNLELEGTGVHASAVCPGFMRTELFEANGLTDVRDSVPPFMWLDPARVAEQAIRAVERGASIAVSGIPNRLIVTAAKIVPRPLLRDRTKIFHRKAHDAIHAESASRSAHDGRRRSALVTGASAGIGASFTKLLAQQGYDLILVARRAALLEERAADLTRAHGVRVHCLPQDLTDRRAPATIHAACETLGWPVDVLVNNAGYPVNQLFHRMAWPEVDAAIQLLARSPIHLTHSFLPGMLARGWGRIINVASLAGFEPGSYRSSLYSSAKAFLIGFSESVDSELEGTGVRVTAVCPGFTRTEWTTRNRLSNDSVPDILWMDSDRVAAIGLRGAERGSPLVVAGTPAQRVVTTLLQLGPRNLVGRFLSSKRKKMMDAGV